MKQHIYMRALDWSYTKSNYDSKIIKNYGRAVLRACFEVLGAEVSWVDLPWVYLTEPGKKHPQMNNDFLRDRGVLFESAGQRRFLTSTRYEAQSQLILSSCIGEHAPEPSALGEQAKAAETGAETVQRQNEASRAVPTLERMPYFEGGNVLIDGNTFFHMPSTPGGFYSKNYQDDKGLASQLGSIGLEVLDLGLDEDWVGASIYVSSAERGLASNFECVSKKTLYHLDCFMSVLPDGRCVISNLDLLNKRSQEKLRHHFGARLIDLNLPGQDCVLNIQSIVNPQTGEICLVADQLSDDAIIKLEEQTGCRVITPQTLDPESRFYDQSFSKAVYEKLVEYGFNYIHLSAVHIGRYSAEEDVLHHFPMHQNILEATDQVVGHQTLEWNLAKVEKSIDPETKKEKDGVGYYQPVQFIRGVAGVHCLVQETFIPNAKALQKKKQMIVLRNRIGAFLCLGGASLAGAAYLTSAVTPLVMIVSGVVLGVGFLIGVMCHYLDSKQIGPQTQTPDQVSRGRDTQSRRSVDLTETFLLQAKTEDSLVIDSTESKGSGPTRTRT